MSLLVQHFYPQLSSNVKAGGSSLSGLASLAGINLGGMEGFF